MRLTAYFLIILEAYKPLNVEERLVKGNTAVACCATKVLEQILAQSGSRLFHVLSDTMILLKLVSAPGLFFCFLFFFYNYFD